MNLSRWFLKFSVFGWGFTNVFFKQSAEIQSIFITYGSRNLGNGIFRAVKQETAFFALIDVNY